MDDFRQILINEQYLIIKKIGQGGFGVVWRAYDFSLRNYIAIKELIKEHNEPKHIEMLYKEALIAKNIIHENIVRVQHFWQGSNGSYYISMDYVTGKDLEHLISACNRQSVRIPWELCVLIAGGVLKAIDHANRLAKDIITGKPYGIVYRDISPGNVMLSYDGNIKLSDFGTAKTAEEMSDGIKKHVITGKYAYMSPEQIKGDPDVDHRSDIFSIGVVLYEMLTGRQLFRGDAHEIRDHVINTKFDPALLDNMNLPFELAPIIEKALDKDKESRYEKAIEMFRDLRRLLKGKETEELSENLSEFLAKVLEADIAEESELLEQVKQLNMQAIKSDRNIVRITCKDFIVGETETGAVSTPGVPQFVPPHSKQYEPEQPYHEPVRPQAPPPAQQPVQPPVQYTHPPAQYTQPPEQYTQPPAQQRYDTPTREEVRPEVRYVQPPQQPPVYKRQSITPQMEMLRAEEKGKTVFEEVGDWLVTKFKIFYKRMLRFASALIFAFVMFAVVDTSLHITPMGKMIYSKIYPPDIVITTVPGGALVSLKSREGQPVLTDADSTHPVELRQIQPGIYTLTAVKQNFRTVERVIKIEEPGKGMAGKKQQAINVNFEFTLAINSVPPGAEVFVDGNRFNVTPCKGEFVAGEHTLKLQMNGFDELGSMAKETKTGACNIDFTKPNPDEAFSGVDKRYWEYQIQNSEGGSIFSLTGHFFKKVKFTSEPSNLIVHIEGESQPRGNTPITIPLKAGEYKVRFLDPEGKFEESVRTVNVGPVSESNISSTLDKWVTIKIRSKEHHNEGFTTTVRITGIGVNITRSISTNKALRVALPIGAYKMVFDGDMEYANLVMKSVNIADKSLIMGEMEYKNASVKVSVKDKDTNLPVNGAYVWIANKVAGQTNEDGNWEGDVLRSTATIKIVAKGYIDKTIKKEIVSDNETVQVLISVNKPTPSLPGALPNFGSQQQSHPAGSGAGHKIQSNINSNGFTTRRNSSSDSGSKNSDYNNGNTDVTPPQQAAPVQTQAPVEQQAAPAKTTIVCPNCGKVYEVSPGKKLRFCINCGHPFQ